MININKNFVTNDKLVSLKIRCNHQTDLYLLSRYNS